MVPFRIRRPPLLQHLLWILTAANFALAVHNITVDDTSTDIVYTGTWLTSHTQSTRYNSTTHYTRVEGSYATFSFTGASQIYFIGYGLIASAVSNTFMQVTFDTQVWRVDQSATTATRAQAILWTSGPIDPTVTHTIVCTKSTADNGGMDMNVDAFILTIPDATASSSSAISSSSTTSSTPNSASSPSQTSTTLSPLPDVWTPPPDDRSNSSAAQEAPQSTTTSIIVVSRPSTNTAAIVGGILGALALVAIIAAIFFFLGRRRGEKVMEKEPTPLFGAANTPPIVNHDPDATAVGGGGSRWGGSRRTGTTKRREREEMRSPATSDPRTSSDVYSIPIHTESGWASGPPAYTPMNSDPLLARSDHRVEPVEEEVVEMRTPRRERKPASPSARSTDSRV